MTVSLNTMKFHVKVYSLPVLLTQFVPRQSFSAHRILGHRNLSL